MAGIIVLIIGGLIGVFGLGMVVGFGHRKTASELIPGTLTFALGAMIIGAIIYGIQTFVLHT